MPNDRPFDKLLPQTILRGYLNQDFTDNFVIIQVLVRPNSVYEIPYHLISSFLHACIRA